MVPPNSSSVLQVWFECFSTWEAHSIAIMKADETPDSAKFPSLVRTVASFKKKKGKKITNKLVAQQRRNQKKNRHLIKKFLI